MDCTGGKSFVLYLSSGNSNFWFQGLNPLRHIILYLWKYGNLFVTVRTPTISTNVEENSVEDEEPSTPNHL